MKGNHQQVHSGDFNGFSPYTTNCIHTSLPCSFPKQTLKIDVLLKQQFLFCIGAKNVLVFHLTELLSAVIITIFFLGLGKLLFFLFMCYCCCERGLNLKLLLLLLDIWMSWSQLQNNKLQIHVFFKVGDMPPVLLFTLSKYLILLGLSLNKG